MCRERDQLVIPSGVVDGGETDELVSLSPIVFAVASSFSSFFADKGNSFVEAEAEGEGEGEGRVAPCEGFSPPSLSAISIEI